MPGPARDAARRLCLPPAAWPAIDQACWLVATRHGDLLLDDGPAAHLRPGSLDKHADGYGRWLAWLVEQGKLEEADPPAARVTRERVTAYVAALRRANAPRTVLNRLTDLATVLYWFAPGQDWDWLHRCLAKLRARVQPVRDKRARLRSAHELLALGRQLMHAAATDNSPAPPQRDRARLYRDGLMIALLAARPSGSPISFSSSSAGSWFAAVAAGGSSCKAPIPRPASRSSCRSPAIWCRHSRPISPPGATGSPSRATSRRAMPCG